MTSTTTASVNPRSSAASIRDDDEALDVARRVAAVLVGNAADRERERRLLHDEMRLIASSGLGGITVPEQQGGPSLKFSTLVKVVEIITRADSSAGQVLALHYCLFALDFLRRRSDWRGDMVDETWSLICEEALAGKLFGSANVERGVRHPLDYKTRAARQADGSYLLNGTKFYSTGALYADWLHVVALDSDDRIVRVLVKADSPGVERIDDWDGFGQRLTASGTTKFVDVKVSAKHLLRISDKDNEASKHSIRIFGGAQTAQIAAAGCTAYHTAIALGIARAAFEDGVNFLREKARPWSYAGVERAADEPMLLALEGDLLTRLHASEAMLDRASAAVEATRASMTEANVLAARLAVAQAKAICGDTAIDIASEIFTLGGTQATSSRYNLDRHWRNARTHATHDPSRWLYHALGNAEVNGVLPPSAGKL